MKKKKRIFRIVMSTMLLCCMLVGDLGSVFATSVVSDKQDSSKEVQTSVESDNDFTLSNQNEQSSNITDESVIEEPEVEIKPEEENTIEATEVNPDVEHDDNVPVEEPVEPSVETATPSETDNWSLDLVFYDSTVDGGKTPIKNIDWDASNLHYSKDENRIITVQVNYKNTNSLKAYKPGSIRISIPNLASNIRVKNVKAEISGSVNDSMNSGYVWNYISGDTISSSGNIETLFFENNIGFDEGTNFEGSFQIKYSLTSLGEDYTDINDEKYSNECIESINKDISVLLSSSDLVYKTESVLFKYYRKYNHPWYKYEFVISEEAKKLNSYDGLGSNSSNYIWVNFNIKDNTAYEENAFNSTDYPHIMLKHNMDYYTYVNIPEGCILYDWNMNLVNKDESSGLYKLVRQTTSVNNFKNYNIYVGYPKSVYNGDNLTVSNKIYLCGNYANESQYSLLNFYEDSVDLSKYDINYEGELYSITKKSAESTLYSDLMKNSHYSVYDYERYDCGFKAVFTGKPMTVRWGDDLLYISDKNNNLRKLSDSEYEFESVSIPEIRNLNNAVIPRNKYNISLYVRYEGEKEYIKYEDVTNYKDKVYFKSLKNKSVVGFYFELKDSLESIIVNSNDFCNVKFKVSDNIKSSGKVWNYNYLKVFSKKEDGTLVLENVSSMDNYPTNELKDIVSEYDLKTYSNYIYRSCGSTSYKDWDPNNISEIVNAYKTNCNKVYQDGVNKKFYGSFSMGVSGSTTNTQYEGVNHKDLYLNFWEELELDRLFISKFKIYDLLPIGMELESSKEEIIDSIDNNYCNVAYTLDKTTLSHDELNNIIKSNMNVSIVKNWRSTGRTMLSIDVDLSKTPILLFRSYSGGINFFEVTYDWSVSFDSFIDYGSSYKNYVYVESYNSLGDSLIGKHSNKVADSGVLDKDLVDIDGDGDTTEILGYNYGTAIIDYIIDSHQDVQTSVQTDKSNYTTGLVKASPESEYSYKLRARSGSNQVSNLVLVNNLEEGYRENEYWKGKFLGIDTSFAESKTYKVYKPSDQRADVNGYVQEKVKVKPYYSTSTTEGELYQTEEKVITDPSGEQIKQRVRVLDEHGNFVKNSNWLEYSDSVDKNTVKSLAFEFLDAETGEQAILPENNLIYVEVNMKAPVESDGLTADGTTKYAYNNCFTQWNALDNMGQTVDFITGINSNTVRVTVNDRVSVNINKIWEDEDNKYNTRPESVEFIMKKDGKEISRQTLKKGETFVTFSNLLIDELSSYTFEEVCPKGYNTDGVIYDRLSDTYTVTNSLNPSLLTEIKGIKTWVNDSESKIPESITVNLYRNNEKIDSKVVKAIDGWSYNFGKFIKNDPNGVKYKYRVEEEFVEGWIPSYTSDENGLKIKFSNQSKTEGATFDYVEIYYLGDDGKIYKLPKVGGSSIAGKVVSVPSKDFWLYWRTDSSSSGYYGFSIDSIESAIVDSKGTVATLPNYTVEELSGNRYPDSAFDKHTHGNYGNNVNKIWHYTSNENTFNIINTSNLRDISGTKTWEGDTTDSRPSSITVNLLQNGKKFMSTKTDASKGWKYSFKVPKLDSNFERYVYSVEEEPVKGYLPTYSAGNGCKITFSKDSETESASFDYLEVYYELDGEFYKAGKFGGNSISGASISLPTKDFYLHWVTDGGASNYYGYSIESIEGIEYNTVVGVKSNFPSEKINYYSDIKDLQSKHFPYENNENKWLAYKSKVGSYDILNTANITTISGTKHWVGDTESERPESVTINLLQNGVKYDTVTTDASKGWKYSFEVPITDEKGLNYNYELEEVKVDDYISNKGTGSRITFSPDSVIDSYDRLSIFYTINNLTYSVDIDKDTPLSNYSIDIPSSHFYIDWYKSSYTNSKFSVKSVESIDCKDLVGNPRLNHTINPDIKTTEVDLLHSKSEYTKQESFIIEYKDINTCWDITNRKDNIIFNFSKELRDIEYNSFSGIGFSVYENTKESGYPKVFPGKSNEWVKVSDAKVSDKGLCEVSGLRSNKEYFLVENASEVTINYRDISTKHKILNPKNLCYVIKTGDGYVKDIYTTIYGYSSNGGDYYPKKSINADNFFKDYGGDVVGSDLNIYLDEISSRYDFPTSISKKDFLSNLLTKFSSYDLSCSIDNYVEKRVINVTKRIKASDINFDNGNPTFIFEQAFIERNEDAPIKSIVDIKSIEFTKDYVEANTDSDGFVSKTITFEKTPTIEGVSISVREVQSSRYNVSNVTCNENYTLVNNNTEVKLGFLSDVNTNIDIVFTNNRYENQYYGHNSIILNKINRNKQFYNK